MALGGFGMVDEHLRDKRILVVDDERDLASMVAAILRGAGFARVDVAHSGEEALAALDGRPVRSCPANPWSATASDRPLPAASPLPGTRRAASTAPPKARTSCSCSTS